MLRKLFLLLQGTLIVFACFAQTARVSGKITDIESGSPLVGATISITGSESKKGITTDVEGRFFITLELNKKYTVVVTSIGYTSITARTTTEYKSTILGATADIKLTDPFNNAAPNLTPAAGSPVLTGALFDFGKLNDAFFEKVSYVGAFDGTTNWTTGWAVWGK